MTVTSSATGGGETHRGWYRYVEQSMDLVNPKRRQGDRRSTERREAQSSAQRFSGAERRSGRDRRKSQRRVRVT